MTYRIGDKIHINFIENDINGLYEGLEGTVTNIDEEGWLYGTWGYLPIIPDYDSFELIQL